MKIKYKGEILMKKRILIALGGIVVIVSSILFIPYCGGDGGYLLLSIPIGLVMIFGQHWLDLD